MLLGCRVGSMPHSYASSFARFHLFGPASEPSTSEKTAKTAASAASTRIGTYKLIALITSACSRAIAGGSAVSVRLGRRRHLRHCVDQAVDRVAATGFGQVPEQFHGEPHHGRALHAMPGRELHEAGMADHLHERAGKREVPAISVFQRRRVAAQR